MGHPDAEQAVITNLAAIAAQLAAAQGLTELGATVAVVDPALVPFARAQRAAGPKRMPTALEASAVSAFAKRATTVKPDGVSPLNVRLHRAKHHKGRTDDPR